MHHLSQDRTSCMWHSQIHSQRDRSEQGYCDVQPSYFSHVLLNYITKFYQSIIPFIYLLVQEDRPLWQRNHSITCISFYYNVCQYLQSAENCLSLFCMHIVLTCLQDCLKGEGQWLVQQVMILALLYILFTIQCYCICKSTYRLQISNT